MFFFHQHCGLAIFGVCVAAHARQLSSAVEVPLTPTSQCERHDEGCNVDDEQLAMPREDDVKGLELLQLDLHFQSKSVGEKSPSIITERSKDNQISGIAAKENGRKEIDSKPKVSAAAISDIGFRSPLGVFSALEVSAHVKPKYNHTHQHRYVTEFLVTMQRLTLSGSVNSQSIGTVPILILLSCVGCAFLLACMVGNVKRQPRNDNRRVPDAMNVSFGGERALVADSRLPGGGAAQAALPSEPVENTPPRPFPVCRALILPCTEARFAIPIESLMKAMKANAVVDIKGTSGRKLLHGSVNDEEGGSRKLTIASMGSEDDPRVTVLARAHSQPESTSTGPLEIYGKNMEFYGTLELAPDGGAVLKSEVLQKPVMALRMNELADLSMVAIEPGSEKPLAIAGKNVQVGAQSSKRNIQSPDQWKLQVSPNCDAVLIAACMLAYIVLLREE